MFILPDIISKFKIKAIGIFRKKKRLVETSLFYIDY